MARLLELEDHSEALQQQNDRLVIDSARTAVVTVDLHRGHLDPVEATVPIGPELSERVIRGAREVLVFARANGIAVVHVTVTLRAVEAETFYEHPKFSKAALLYSIENPLSDAQRRGVLHNVEGSVQAELVPEIGPEPGDHWITNKKTYSSFMGTDLDNLLRRILGVDTVLIMGVNTNTCVLNAAFDACNHGYRAIVIEEGCASCYGEDLHAFALNAIARTCGWVLTTEELKAKVARPVAVA
jgi:nicotinamidase-related amidase